MAEMKSAGEKSALQFLMGTHEPIHPDKTGRPRASEKHRMSMMPISVEIRLAPLMAPAQMKSLRRSLMKSNLTLSKENQKSLRDIRISRSNY
jgi:hypothetical protein